MCKKKDDKVLKTITQRSIKKQLKDWDSLVKKHYILQVKCVDPFNTEKSFCAFEAWGISCGLGWYDLLDELCTKIEEELDKDPEYKKIFSINQIKEKFGGLRFYVNGMNEDINKLIEEYEDKSYEICEECGAKGKNQKIYGWIYTLCSKHAKEYKNRFR